MDSSFGHCVNPPARGTALAALACLALASTIAPAALADTVVLRHAPIALEGEAAPDTGGGNFAAFGAADQNRHPDVVFRAEIAGGTTDVGIFLAPKAFFDRPLVKVAVAGDAAPGAPGQVYDDFSAPSIDSFLESIVFQATLAPGTPVSSGIFRDTDGSQEPVVLAGDPAPGTSASFLAFGPPRACFSCGDQAIVFMAVLDAYPFQGIFRYRDAGASALALMGDPVPGVPGASLAFFGNPDTEGGYEIAFQAAIDVGGTGIFVATDQDLSLIALEGDPAPDGVAYGGFGPDSVSHYGAGYPRFTDSAAVYDGLVLARVGDPAPGTGGGSYTAFPHRPVCCFRGLIFYADVSGGTTPGGIFRENLSSGGPLMLIGDAAPGTGGGSYAGFPYAPSKDVLYEYHAYFSYTADVTGGATDSGVFLLPETGAEGAVAGAALLGMLGHSRRRR